jgi:hypothetical protein
LNSSMNNPYQAPATSNEPVPRRPYTRRRLILDVFAILFSTLPLLTKGFVALLLTEDAYDGLQSYRAIIIYFVVLILMWPISIILNIIGCIRCRMISVFGLVLNVAMVIWVWLRW